MYAKRPLYRAGVRRTATNRLWESNQDCVGRGVRKSSRAPRFEGEWVGFSRNHPAIAD